MTTLTDKMDALETQLAAQNATIAGYIDTVEAKLQSIDDIINIMNENAAANTKYILAALGQSAACFPCPTPSIVVPPTVTIPIGIDEDKCKRAQAFIATMHAIFTAMDTMQSFNVMGTYNVVNDAINQVIGGIISGDTPPLPSFPEAMNIVGDYISYAGERVFSGVSLMEQFEPLESALTDAVYLAANAAAAQMAYISVIEASGVSNGARLLFEASAYNALYSYFFNPDTDPDLSGFSGDACGAPTECVTLLSEESFTMTKTCDNGNDWTLFEIPSWAVRVEWSITFSDGFNVVWGSGAPGSCEAFPGTVASQGFFASAANEWDHTFGATSYFGVGGFFSGLPNGSTRDVTIHYLRACPAV